MTDERDTEQRDNPEKKDQGINDPLVRTDVEAPRAEFEGRTEPKK